jgi:glycosyltransferase involved in cell wall biosynthesis
MKITVILCTYNRCETIGQALTSVAASILPESVAWEVLVVDNHSTDQTRVVVEDFCRRHPGRFRYLFEPKQGKSHALNAGIQQAQGDVLAFMDDDVVVEPTWLRNLTAALEDGQWAGAGGRILPDWKCSPPGWLSLEGRYSLAPLAAFDPGLNAGELKDAPFGTNMAFRKVMFEKYGGFRIDLGPTTQGDYREWYSASCPRTSEDTEFGERLLSAGERLYYEPSAIVHHPVPANRLTKGYFLAWRFGQARADIRLYGIPADTKWYVAQVPLYLFCRLAMGTIRWVTAFEPRRRFRYKLAAWACVGQMVECRRQSPGAKIAKTNRESNAHI